MRNLIIGLLGFAVACGGGSGNDNTDAPTNTDGDIDGPAATCNPVVNTGCAPGEKCGWVTIREDDDNTPTDEYLGILKCNPLPSDPKGEGEVCDQGTPGTTTGFSNCDAGFDCLSKNNSNENEGVCTKMCQTSAADPCGSSDFVCGTYSNFYDFDGSEVGFCQPLCNAALQDCPAGDGACYYRLNDGTGACARVPDGTQGISQGDECYGPSADPRVCYLNGCPAGLGAMLYLAESQRDALGLARPVCANFCEPETVSADPNDNGTPTGNPNGNNCASLIGHECRRISTFYLFMDPSLIDDDIGICVPVLDQPFNDQGQANIHPTGAPLSWYECSDITIREPVQGEATPPNEPVVDDNGQPLADPSQETATQFQARRSAEIFRQAGCVPKSRSWWATATTLVGEQPRLSKEDAADIYQQLTN